MDDPGSILVTDGRWTLHVEGPNVGQWLPGRLAVVLRDWIEAGEHEQPNRPGRLVARLLADLVTLDHVWPTPATPRPHSEPPRPPLVVDLATMTVRLVSTDAILLEMPVGAFARLMVEASYDELEAAGQGDWRQALADLDSEPV